MIDIITTIVLISFCLFVSMYDYKREKTLFTPFNLMVYPYVVIVMMINLGGKYFGFYSVNIRSAMFVISCLAFFMFGGWLIGTFLGGTEFDEKVKAYNKTELHRVFQEYKNLFIVLAIISIIVSVVHFFRSLNEVGGWVGIATKEFSEIYGKGIFAHIIQLNRPAFVFLSGYYFYSRNKFVLLLLFLMFSSILVLQIKTHIITTLLAGLIFGYLFHVIKFNFKKIILYSIIIFILFNVSYTIGFSRAGLSTAFAGKTQIYLVYHFFTYLFGGPIGLSEIFDYSTYPLYSWKEIFAVPINIIHLLSGKPEIIEVIFYDWIPVSTNYRYFHSTNVFTFFGMIYMYVGLFGTYLFMFFTGVVSYLLKKLVFKKNAYIGLQLIYAFYLSFLAMSFFGNFFNLLQIYHTSFLMITLPFLYAVAKKAWRYVKTQFILYVDPEQYGSIRLN